MPADENTRLSIRQYLIELMDEQAADAMMETMAPIPWTQLATKDDLAQLGARIDNNGARIDSNGNRIDRLSARIDSNSDRIDGLSARIDGLSYRIDGIGDRMDGLGTRMDELGRAVTIGAATVAVTLAIFLAGTLLSLISSGALG